MSILNRNSGLTLTEVVMSTLIVGVMAAGALQSLGAATRSAEAIGDRGTAIGLAEELLAEIMQRPYDDPDGTDTMGPDTGEDNQTRVDMDDIDDYDGWSAMPPQLADGTVITGRDSWRRSVVVRHVAADDLTTNLGNADDQGLKRITVTIENNGTPVLTQTTVRSSAWTGDWDQ